jgi:predicted patatin/cPLA2 family phospholipase
VHSSQVRPEIEYEARQELIDQQNEQQSEFICFPSHKITNKGTEKKVDRSQNEFQRQDIGKILIEQMIVPGYFPPAEILYAQVK